MNILSSKREPVCRFQGLALVFKGCLLGLRAFARTQHRDMLSLTQSNETTFDNQGLSSETTGSSLELRNPHLENMPSLLAGYCGGCHHVPLDRVTASPSPFRASRSSTATFCTSSCLTFKAANLNGRALSNVREVQTVPATHTHYQLAKNKTCGCLSRAKMLQSWNNSKGSPAEAEFRVRGCPPGADNTATIQSALFTSAVAPY